MVGRKKLRPLTKKLVGESRITVNIQCMDKTVALSLGLRPERLTREASSVEKLKIQSSPLIRTY